MDRQLTIAILRLALCASRDKSVFLYSADYRLQTWNRFSHIAYSNRRLGPTCVFIPPNQSALVFFSVKANTLQRFCFCFHSSIRAPLKATCLSTSIVDGPESARNRAYWPDSMATGLSIVPLPPHGATLRFLVVTWQVSFITHRSLSHPFIRAGCCDSQHPVENVGNAEPVSWRDDVSQYIVINICWSSITAFNY